MTFAEFEKLPDPPGARLELHHGDVLEVPPAKHGHYRVQHNLRDLLHGPAAAAGIVGTEFGFRPIADHEYWIADVAFLFRARWDGIPAKGNLQGAPDLVIEVLSPSNTVAEIREKKKLCLENGSKEFWAVDQDHREVEVYTPDGRSVTYKSGDKIPLFFAPGKSVVVDQIFA